MEYLDIIDWHEPYSGAPYPLRRRVFLQHLAAVEETNREDRTRLLMVNGRRYLAPYHFLAVIGALNEAVNENAGLSSDHATRDIVRTAPQEGGADDS